mgnify:CR=1 FL=1
MNKETALALLAEAALNYAAAKKAAAMQEQLIEPHPPCTGGNEPASAAAPYTDFTVLAEYKGNGHREWATVGEWLYPGDVILSATRIKNVSMP